MMMKRILQQSGLFSILVFGNLATAQEDVYEKNISPGITVAPRSTGGTELAEAARNRRSIVISSGAEPENQPLAMQQESTIKHTVKAGDSLWAISERYFEDPYQWPRLWSYNMEITNPNWIYPGDTIQLYRSDVGAGDGTVFQTSVGADDGAGGSRSGVMPGDAILFRNHGFVDKEALDRSGEIVGAHRQTLWIAQHEEGYVEFPEIQPHPGDRFAAFEITRPVRRYNSRKKIGNLVEIKGLVRVVSFNPETKIARILVEEALSPIERGTLIGPVHRNLDAIPPVRNEKDLAAHIIAFQDPTVLAATHHVVFIDVGRADGVQDGNRFFAVEQVDGLRRINRERDEYQDRYPKEVIAELRVVETRRNTATCLITGAIREIEMGQKLEARKGY